MDIFHSITQDHRIVRTLLNSLISLNDRDLTARKKLLSEIHDQLIPHSRAEESVFYNSIRSLTPSSKIMKGFREHREAEGLLRVLMEDEHIGVEWRPTALTLQSALEHHMEIEETEIFPLARRFISPLEALQLAEAFTALKPQIHQDVLNQGAFEMVVNLMPPRFVSAGGRKRRPHTTEEARNHL